MAITQYRKQRSHSSVSSLEANPTDSWVPDLWSIWSVITRHNGQNSSGVDIWPEVIRPEFPFASRGVKLWGAQLQTSQRNEQWQSFHHLEMRLLFLFLQGLQWQPQALKTSQNQSRTVAFLQCHEVVSGRGVLWKHRCSYSVP